MYNAHHHCHPIGVYQHPHLFGAPHRQDFQKIWHWFMRITMPNIYERQGHLSDEKIHDLMNLIYDGNPLKYITIVEPNPLYIRVIGAWTLLCQKGGIC